MHSPGRGFDPYSAEADDAIERVRASGARLCFLALGSPRQEIFAARCLDRIPGIGLLCIGASLDFIAGTQVRAPRLAQRMGLEWFWRAVLNPKRLAPLPNVPTFAEIGYPDIVASTWFGVAVPVKTPRPVIARITEAHRAVVARPDYKERLDTLAMEPLILTPQQTQAFLNAEINKWKKVVDAAGIKIDQ